ncbi:MAG: type II toxin-antitoxin system RelE/ParE family toxin [Planctomycetota bacterium]|nr:MAG: type II toxin-antitoxin system RelE/ParE family toxin [Planctomycetota bacterium]RKY12235.1 MAG: type II toxin-antitoxin system RelE/ParE family toxin [Planctomycetota bacterium]
MYKVDVGPKASKFVRKQDAIVQQQLIRKLRELENDPRPHGCKRLQGKKNLYRVRSGDYRIIYTIKDNQLLVLVVQIGHRRDVYRET